MGRDVLVHRDSNWLGCWDCSFPSSPLPHTLVLPHYGVVVPPVTPLPPVLQAENHITAGSSGHGVRRERGNAAGTNRD